MFLHIPAWSGQPPLIGTLVLTVWWLYRLVISFSYNVYDTVNGLPESNL